MWRTSLKVAAIFLVHAVVLQARDQSGFISIDCGAPSISTDEVDIQYISDDGFVSSGVPESVKSNFTSYFVQQQLWTLRSFPKGKRNCYKINNITRGSKYLIRLQFLYGNYDGLNSFPEFDVFLGVNRWDTVKFRAANLDAGGYNKKEIIHIASQGYINICLVNTGLGTPFISTIDLRPFRNNTYVVTSPSGGSLVTYYHVKLGYPSSNYTTRYKDDPYDRSWTNFMENEWVKLNSSSSIAAGDFSQNDYQLPAAVMSTAIRPANVSDPLVINWRPRDPISDEYYIYMHFMEVEVELNNNQTREFNIFVDGKPFYENLVPPYLSTKTITAVSNAINISFQKTPRSTLPPIINAIEVYGLIQFHQLDTFQADVGAITRIQSVYGLTTRDEWQGDPCGPVGYTWHGLNCTAQLNQSPRITALNLSSSGLTGAIDSSFSDLTMLEKLDLSNNDLNGQVPEYLSQLHNLKILNLAGNNLSGSIPSILIEKSNKGFLLLNVDQNPYLLCESGGCKRKKKKLKPLLVVVAIGISVALVAVANAAVVWTLKKRKTKKEKTPKEIKKDDDVSLKFNNKIYSYSDIIKITNNFRKILGKGGFGTVYMGYVDDAPVAVKMLSQSSVQGYQQFQSEVKLLMRVHHKNLTSLVGYCNEGTNKALIYEYMANGNLREHLSAAGTKFLSWKDRLCIAVDAAQGLEYLHNGCKPPIIHRDVKASNILLAENLHAKLSDFGLSKIIPTDGSSHISTVVAGTVGYLDPNYYQSSRLTEKSDVYSFGVVLLELITGQAAIRMAEDDDDNNGGKTDHLSRWVSWMVERGDIHGIVDSRLGEDFDRSSAWKVVETAMACVSRISNERPIMSEVLIELKDALAMELSRINYGDGGNNNNGDSPVELLFVNVQNESPPLAR